MRHNDRLFSETDGLKLFSFDGGMELMKVMEVPVVELDKCILCEVCIDVCPDVFSMNDLGYVEVKELDEYPFDDVHEAVINCPVNCIVYST